MNRPIAVILIACLFLTTACSGMSEEQKSAGEGAAIGATLGALVGKVMGDDTESTLTGAAIGAMVGGIVGYSLASNLNKEKAKLKGHEKDLDALIAYTQAVNDETRLYNQKLEADLKKIESEVAKGRIKKAQMADINKKIKSDKKRLDKELADLQTYRKNLPAKKLKGVKANLLDEQIETLEAQLAGLETNIKNLASIAQRVKV